MPGFRKVGRSSALSLLALTLAFGLLWISIGVAGAQEGPQFPNWGPGMAPPDQEGVGTAAPSPSDSVSPDAAQGERAGAAPSAAAPPPGGSGACQYDLRGIWWNDGRMTSGGTYSARVYVRQYQSWIHAEQDDGTSYYGRCIGNQVQLDVYAGWQFAGIQNGTITTSSWGGSSWDRGRRGWPRGSWDRSAELGAAEAVAPAAAPAPGVGGTRVSFTWTTWYGSGAETWTR